MATDVRNIPAYIDNDADFRLWGGGISAQLAAVGMVQTSDTGQANWATAVGADSPYEVWRFNDALQATKPIFFRLRYQSAGAGVLAIWVGRVLTAREPSSARPTPAN